MNVAPRSHGPRWRWQASGSRGRRPNTFWPVVLPLVLAGIAVPVAGGAAAAPPPPFHLGAAAGARSAGMGGVFVAAADGAPAVFYNPAALAIPWFAASFGATLADRPVGAEFALDPSGVAQRLREVLQEPGVAASTGLQASMTARTAVAVQGSAVGLLAEAAADFQPGGGRPMPVGSGYYLSAIVFGAGGWVHTGWSDARLAVGSAVRLLYGEQVRADGEKATRYVAHGYSAGLGVRVEWRDLVTVGLSAPDLVGTLGWQERRSAGASEASSTTLGTEQVQWWWPAESVQVGIALHPSTFPMVLAADYRLDGSWRVGGEQRIFFDALALRVGYAGRAGDTPAHQSVGLGLKLGPVHADAAVQLPVGDGPPAVALDVGLRF